MERIASVWLRGWAGLIGLFRFVVWLFGYVVEIVCLVDWYLVGLTDCLLG